MMSQNNIQTTQQLVSFKKILDFSCYVKIERNGFEMKMKYNQNSICKVLLMEFVYKVNQSENKTVHKIQFKSSNDQEFFLLEINLIDKIIDKMISEGKLTILLKKGEEKINVFLFKTTKDILENFIKQLEKIKDAGSIKNIPSNNNIINLSTISQPNLENKNRKRKLQDLYAQSGSSNSNLQIKRFKQNSINDQVPVIKTNTNKLNLADLSEDIFYSLFEYIDNKNLVKVSLLNKDCKIKYDKFIERLKVRDDIPSRSFNNLLNRFPNLKHLNLGEGKYLKNENFKHFDVDLKNLTSLDMKEILNLNESSIRKLLSKTRSSKISSIKANFLLESLTSVLFYVSEFFINIREIEIFSEYTTKDMGKTLKRLEDCPKIFHPSLFNVICEVIQNKKHLNSLSLYLFNTVKLNSEFQFYSQKGKSLLGNLTVLSIHILVIEKAKDLNFLTSAVNLVELKINEICVIDNDSNIKKIKQCDFSEIIMIPDNLELMNPEEQIDNLNLDFDNDYVEVFISLFSKMKCLTNLSLGEFVNGEISKVVSLFCKGIKKFTINSNKITDGNLLEILNNCREITNLDLRGCGVIQGNCFLELDNFPTNLKNVKMSLTNYNFYNLIKFLKDKGVSAENYINKLYN